MRFKISRGIPQTLEEKRARVGGLIEHADHSQLINSSIPATLSQRVTVVTLNQVWTRSPMTVPGMDYKTFTARRTVMGMKMKIAGPKRRAYGIKQPTGDH